MEEGSAFSFDSAQSWLKMRAPVGGAAWQSKQAVSFFPSQSFLFSMQTPAKVRAESRQREKARRSGRGWS